MANPFDVDVALAFDGENLTGYLGVPGFKSPTSGVPSGQEGGPIEFKVTNPTFQTSALDQTAAPLTALPYFRIGADYKFGAVTEDLTLSNVRLYGRVLSPVELQNLTTLTCDKSGCGAAGRACAAGNAGAVPMCGNCSGGFEGASTPGGQCFPALPFLAECLNDSQCATGLCAHTRDQGSVCASPTVDDTCRKSCGAYGRECVESVTIPKYATCSTWCAKNFKPPEDGDTSKPCIWSPTTEDGDVCDTNYDCKSGTCSKRLDSWYDAVLSTPESCEGITLCDGWINTNTNAGFACRASSVNASVGYYGGYYCPPFASVTLPRNQPMRGRCAGTTAAICEDNHQKSTLLHSAGVYQHDAYQCSLLCSPEQYEGKPLWVQAYRFLSPYACKKMWENNVRRGIERRGNYFEIQEDISLGQIKRLLFDKEGVVTPAEWSSMAKNGVGEALLAYATAPEAERRKIRDQFGGRLSLADCTTPEYTVDLPFDDWKYVTDERTGITQLVTTKKVVSPFFDPNVNGITCAANKFPDGTICPPPNAGENNRDKRGDTFCDSGFCGRDTGTCEEGYGRLEKPVAADRGDANQQPDGGGFGPVKLIQTNKTTMEMRKIVQDPPSTGAAIEREYTLMATNKQALSFFGSDPANLLELEMTMHAEMEGEEGDFDSKVFVFDLQLPGGQTPAASCSEHTWENGEYKKPEKPCSLPQDAEELIPDVPQFKLCLPSPGGCEDDEEVPPIKPARTTSRGPLCWKQISFVGPVPITIQAEVTIDACIGLGAEVDSETMEPGFQITPSLGLGVDLRGGVGGEWGPVEAFAGAHAVITIVEIEFPIKWALKIEAIEKDHKNESISNMWDIQFFRGISAELTVLKLAISLFAEVGVSILKVEWDYIIFQFGGLKFVWDLDEHTISSVKLDLEHPTANQ